LLYVRFCLIMLLLIDELLIKKLLKRSWI